MYMYSNCVYVDIYTFIHSMSCTVMRLHASLVLFMHLLYLVAVIRAGAVLLLSLWLSFQES